MAFVWLGAGAILSAALGWEYFWRRRGFVPWVKDDWPAWALLRRCAGLKGADAVALVGASRLQVGLSLDILTELTGRRPVMLAVDGCPPWAVLADLADDPTFTGTVICSLMPSFLAEPDAAGDRSVKWIRKSRRISPFRRLLWRFWFFLQGRVACLSPDLTVSKLLFAIETATWPNPHRAPMSADRSRRLDTAKVDVDALRQARERRERSLHALARPLPPGRFGDRLNLIAGRVDAITRRGGRVIFLRLPSSGVVCEMERRTWPREVYWDRLAAHSRARTLHFEDDPQLAGLQCPDGSHLEAEDARRFSRALVKILRAGTGEEEMGERKEEIGKRKGESGKRR